MITRKRAGLKTGALSFNSLAFVSIVPAVAVTVAVAAPVVKTVIKAVTAAAYQNDDNQDNPNAAVVTKTHVNFPPLLSMFLLLRFHFILFTVPEIGYSFV